MRNRKIDVYYFLKKIKLLIIGAKADKTESYQIPKITNQSAKDEFYQLMS